MVLLVQTKHEFPSQARPVQNKTPTLIRVLARDTIQGAIGIPRSPIRGLIRAFEFVLAIGLALLCSYWIVQGRW
jgi:hypothetical protein